MSIWQRSGIFARDTSSDNQTPIHCIVQDPITISGVSYYPVMAYTTGKIFMSVDFPLVPERESTYTYNTWQIISASFTAFVFDKQTIYIRGTYQRKKGSMGLFIEKKEVDMFVNIINSYNSKLGITTQSTPSDIIDKDLFEV